MPTKTYVGVITTPLIEKNPEPIKDAVFEATLKHQDIAQTIVRTVKNSYKVAARNYYNYGVSHYANGIPKGTLEVGYVSPSILRKVIEDNSSLEPIVLVAAPLDEPEPEIFAYEYLQDNQGYNGLTGVISGHPLTLPIVTAPDTVSAVTFSSAGDIQSNGAITIEYAYTVTRSGVATVEKQTRTYNFPKLDIRDVWYQCVYFLASDSLNIPKYWTHKPGDTSPSYPDLDTVSNTGIEEPFYPIVPVRSNKINLVDTPGALLDTSKRMMKKIAMDIDDLTDAIIENPDIDDIDDAYLMYALDIKTDKPAGLDYLFKFFKELAQTSKTTPAGWQKWYDSFSTGNLTESGPVSVMSIKDGETKITIQFNYIELIRTQGVIGAVDYTDSAIVLDTPITGGAYSTVHRETSYITFRQQTSATHYQSVKVHGIQHSSWILKGKIVVKTLEDIVKKNPTDDDLEGFYIPLSHRTMLTLRPSKRDAVYYEALVLVFQSIQRIKLKWYQTGVFKAVVVIIAVIIAVYTGINLVQLAVAAGSLGGALYVIASFILEAIIVKYAADAIVNVLGDKVAFLTALLVIALAIFSPQSLGSVSPQVANQMSTAVIQGVVRSANDEIKEALVELDLLKEESKLVQKSIDDANELLESAVSLDVILRSATDVLLIEPPTSFYDRTLNRDMVSVTIEDIDVFHAGSLRLPEGIDLKNYYV